MKKISFYILVLALQASTICIAQDNIPRFSEVLAQNLTKFKKESRTAYQEKDFERGRFLFDSLVEHCLVKTKFDNFRVKKLNGKIISINNYFQKPLFLMTNTLWCIKSDEEIAAVNELVKKYHKDIDFVALYWGTKDDIRVASKKYAKQVHVTFINEQMNVFCNEIKNLKHSFGFPTYFFIDKNRLVSNIIKLRQLGPIQKKNGKKSINKSDFESYKKSIEDLILINDFTLKTVPTTTIKVVKN